MSPQAAGQEARHSSGRWCPSSGGVANKQQGGGKETALQQPGSGPSGPAFRRPSPASSRGLLPWLLATLDLRFASPREEFQYYCHYTHVKRQLLPTATRVVLLVNLLQLIATGLHFSLLASESPASATNSLFSLKLIWDEGAPFARTLLLPAAIQLGTFLLTCLVLRAVRAEQQASHGAGPGGAPGSSPNRRRSNHGRRYSGSGGGSHTAAAGAAQKLKSRSSRDTSGTASLGSGSLVALSSDSSASGSSSSSGSSSEEEEDDDQLAPSKGPPPVNRFAKRLGSRRGSRSSEPVDEQTKLAPGSSDSSHSSSSSSSTSSSSSSEDQSDNESALPEHHRLKAVQAIKLSKRGTKSAASEPGNAASREEEEVRVRHSGRHSLQAATTTDGRSLGQLEAGEAATSGRRRHSLMGVHRLSRSKLALPYVLWLCQLLQLASSVWPQQSFIGYSMLLLYTYTVYVIFPIRLMSCILLALGLCVSQPVVDYLLLLSLSQRPDLQPPLAPTGEGTAREQLPGQQQQQQVSPLLQLLHSELKLFASPEPGGSSQAGQPAAEPLLRTGEPRLPPFTLTATANGLKASDLSPPGSGGGEALDNSLLIPMTSQLSKLWAFMLLTLGINVIGLMSFYFYERQQRAAYLEMRKSLDTKVVLAKESKEQERLLLSVLPQHLAREIRRDLDAVVGGQFKKIYMRRHENVSILFADIVGFTAISSHCPAAELVKILNELFARFDKLAEKYHQLRIKILGDCYYAISGAPVERPDHAVLCVHMGLSMVEAIKYVREKTKSTVDMRVGVHTGGVLAGVLGQRQWQFDVYSKDVELANKMESSGLPGRVHISDATLRFLNDEFEVSDGEGGLREEALRLANIKTYFIVRVKKPYPEGTLDARVKDRESQQQATAAAAGDGQRRSLGQAAGLQASAGGPGKRRNGGASGASADIQPGKEPGALKQAGATGNGAKQRSDSFHLETRMHAWSLNFANRETERQFRSTHDIASCISLIGFPITLLSAFLAYLYLYKVRPELAVLYTSTTSLLVFLVLVCVLPYTWRRSLGGQAPGTASSRQQCLSKSLVGVASTVKQSAWMKLALTAFMTLVWLITHFISCQETSLNLTKLAPTRALQLFTMDLFNYFAITCSLAITAVTRISFLIKTLIIMIVIFLQVIMNVTLLSSQLAARFSAPASSGTRASKHLLVDSYHYDQYVFTLTLVTIFLALYWINRQFEANNRALFVWRKTIVHRKEKVADMRQKNEALVYNILPPNVAKIFLGKRTINDEELYSKSYEAVGVLFAAMPNFSDFYSEESVNNQGLECLRFLNEVISDYDALLDKPIFKNIIKIKTMGSTYMAASGLYEGDALEEAAAAAARSGNEGAGDATPTSGEDQVRLKWGHLEQLTEFALALKDTLANINKESFNNFVLRIGINQGPITAGVIGVKKPHFDMWGNTVNVASRMESTGRAGSIQVVQETAVILRHFGFQFDQRGLVSVKGKGQLMTFYLTGREQSAAGATALESGGGQQQPSPQSEAEVAAVAAKAPDEMAKHHHHQPAATAASSNGLQPRSNCDQTAAGHELQVSQAANSQQAPGGANWQQQQPSAAPIDRRIFITPAKADLVADSGASIHLV